MIQFDTLRVDRNKLSDQVANKIQSMILEGELKTGDQLPPERVLVEKFGVSRTVVREAFRLLQERGFVRVVTGSGTYITKADPSVVSQSIGVLLTRQQTGFKDLIEIRRFLEVEIAGMAAQRATQDHLDRMLKTIDCMEAAIPQIGIDPNGLEIFIQADLDFHDILAEATNNSLFPVFLTSIVDLLSDFRRQASSAPGAPETAVKFHRGILECVRNHDDNGVRQLMSEHMAHAERVVSK